MDLNQSMSLGHGAALKTLFFPVLICLNACTPEVATTTSESRKAKQQSGNLIQNINWDSDNKSLLLSGIIDPEDASRVEIFFAGDDTPLGRTNVLQNGSWSIYIKELATTPCEIVVRSDDASLEPAVMKTGANCDVGSSISQRANVAPEAHILRPANDMTITAGDRVDFQGHAVDPDIQGQFNFMWEIDGQAANFDGEIPGPIQFPQAGEFQVRMNVMDDQGAMDATPPMRLIRVLDDTNQTPDSMIIEPADDITIAVGDQVQFRGDGMDPDNHNPLDFNWDFAGQAQFNGRNPGNVQFNSEGVFIVQLDVADRLGVHDPSPDQRAIRVINPNVANQPPESIIIEPASDMQINVGDRVQFRGDGIDPENDALMFDWDFDNVRGNMRQKDPGAIQFDQPGVFRIRMRAQDANGQMDPTPAERLITVGRGLQQNRPPQSIIVQPDRDLTIRMGDEVQFIGQGDDPEGDNPLSFEWDFDNAANNTMGRDAGNIRFDRAGVFRVRMQATDNQNNRDDTPAERIITVVDTATQNVAPESHILSPLEDIVINRGDRVQFAGHGDDPDGNNPLQFEWDFDGAMRNDNVQNPGDLVFDTPGVFNVRFTVMDAMQNPDPTPAMRRITVLDNNNQAPQGIILEPQNDMVINAGDRVRFRGQGDDPDQNNPLNLEWQFDGAAPNRVGPDADIQFDTPGRYRVQFFVQDAHGLGDPTPDIRTIRVR